ncbi:MAG: hypothetical protein ACKVS9_10605 [Phycisphaerae bacterium]
MSTSRLAFLAGLRALTRRDGPFGCHFLRGALLIIPLVAALLLTPSAAGELVFWNKLGSADELANSAIGPGGWVVGSGEAYEAGRFGGGFIRKQAGGYATAKFPGSVLHPLRERGTVEIWIVPKVSQPVAFQYGIWALVGSGAAEQWYMNRGNVYLIWGDGVTGNGFFGGVQFDGLHARTPDEPQQFVTTPGVPVHAAICWDIDGIDGSGDRVRVYRNGVIVGATATAWNSAGTVYQDKFETGAAADTQSHDKYGSDNLKVWDFAKTDFSDRFVEGGLVFWNRLGSATQVTNSEVGPNGWMTGTGAAFEPAKFGNGFINKATTDVAAPQYPGSVLHVLRERGTVEIWIVPKVSSPQPYTHGIYALVGDSAAEHWYMNRGNVYLIWGDTVTGNGFFGGVQFDGMHARTPDEPQQFVTTPGTPVHAAICWDIDGIAGSGDKVRIYRDGILVSATSAAWNPSGTVYQEKFMTGHVAGTAPADRYISDNLKVWNYAKTDFADRLLEPAGSAKPEVLLVARESDCRNLASPTLTVDVEMVNAPQSIIAGQFFVQFDPTLLQLAVSNISAISPWTQRFMATVDNGLGTADVAVAVAVGGGGGGSGRMATLVFDVIDSTCTPEVEVVLFRAHAPATRLTDLEINNYSLANGLMISADLGAIVTDLHAPSIADPGNLMLECSATTLAAIAAWLDSATATDDCGGVSITHDYAGLTGPCPGSGSAVVTWTATDACGNVSTRTRNVTVADSNPPWFDGGSSRPPISAIADAGGCTATLSVTAPTANDDCDASVDVMGMRSDGRSIVAPYPTGDTTITWIASDCAGNAALATQVVTIAPVNEVVVSIAFAGSWTGGIVERCIHFELFRSDCADTVVIDRDVQFTGPIGETVTLQVPCGSYSCMTARDVKHSLRSTDWDFAITGTSYDATFVDEHALLLGNLYQDGDEYRYIDILDFAVLLARFGSSEPPNTPCGFAARHADLTGDALVNLTDMAILLADFGLTQADNCCGLSTLVAGDGIGATLPIAASHELLNWSGLRPYGAKPIGPRTSITVAELLKRGDADLAAADLNRDGVVDLGDYHAGTKRPVRRLELIHSQRRESGD